MGQLWYVPSVLFGLISMGEINVIMKKPRYVGVHLLVLLVTLMLGGITFYLGASSRY